LRPRRQRGENPRIANRTPQERTLTHAEARAFYDRFGARQDAQGVYEDAPNEDLAAHLALGDARTVLEFGCGTGRLAERLLATALPAGAHYCAVDSSRTMVELARGRLARFGAWAEVVESDGSMVLPGADASCDRVLSTYVLDLLSPGDIEALVREMRRVLAPGGLAGITGLTFGAGPLGRTVTALWRTIHRLAPARVGGCRPLELAPFFPAQDWELHHERKHAWYGLTSQVWIARRRPGP
jgi:ubiquinone/menaquinone biosynthesis C-methylase UbiE